MRLAAAIVAVGIGLPGIADAAWFYTWNCTGACAPGQLAIKGVEGPFATYDECESVRWADSRNQTFVAPGNLGGTHTCQQSDAPPSVDGGGTNAQPRRPIPMQRLQLAVIGGPGYTVRTPTAAAAGESTGGLELGLIAGARPQFGIEVLLGVHSSRVTAPYYGPEPRQITFVPFLFGFTSSPGSRSVRLDLGADIGGMFRTGCDECEAAGLGPIAFVAALRAGIDIYFTPTIGVGAGALVLFGKQGDIADEYAPSALEIAPPRVLVRAALTVRNSALSW